LQFDMFEDPVRFETLDDLVTAMHEMDDDPLAALGSKMVIYRGSPAARLMIIGEAPGAEEDRLGEPFVGRSGKLLDQILVAAGVDPSTDVFITNVVFRRPPDNRKPTPQEMEHYKPYLLEIIRLVDPPVLMLAGGAAAESLLGEKRGITKIRGQWFPWSGRSVMPVFHPAYLLRNPSRAPGSPKALMWQDVKAVKRKLDALGADAPGQC
jgi:DNA polymerase